MQYNFFIYLLAKIIWLWSFALRNFYTIRFVILIFIFISVFDKLFEFISKNFE